MQKENLLEDLETEKVKFELVKEYLLELRREFGGGNEESVKVAELKRIEQEGKMMEEFVQEFKEQLGKVNIRRALVEEFKRGMNGGIRRKLMETEKPPLSIEQWYEHTINLD